MITLEFNCFATQENACGLAFAIFNLYSISLTYIIIYILFICGLCTLCVHTRLLIEANQSELDEFCLINFRLSIWYVAQYYVENVH